METIEEKRIGDYLIKIFPDDSAESPDAWGDDGRFLVFQHRQFQVDREGFKPREIFDNNMKVKGYFVFQCFAYIHSGVALSVADHDFPDARWDVSSTGYWLIKREKGTWTRELALKAAQNLCSTWNDYLSGCACGYEILRGDEEEFRDSCYGYYTTEEAIAAAENVIKFYMEETTNEK